MVNRIYPTELIQIQKQYQRIPTFECVPGCTDCCGPVPFMRAELDIIEQKPLIGLACQYKSEAGCTIYEQRPLLCRLFGTVDTPNLTCPRGKGPQAKLTARQGEVIMRHYLRHELGFSPLQDLSWTNNHDYAAKI